MRTLSQSQCVLLLWPPYWLPNGREGLVLSCARCGFGKRMNSSMFDWIILLFYLSVDTYLFIYIFLVPVAATKPICHPHTSLSLPFPPLAACYRAHSMNVDEVRPFVHSWLRLLIRVALTMPMYSVGCMRVTGDAWNLFPWICFQVSHSVVQPFHSQVQKSTFSQPFQEKCINDLLRILVEWSSFVWITYEQFFILCDVIFLVRLWGNVTLITLVGCEWRGYRGFPSPLSAYSRYTSRADF